MEFKAEVQGAKGIEAELSKLSLKIEKNISRRAVGAAAKVLIVEMKSNVHVRSGTLKRSIGMKRLKVRKTVTVIIGPRSGKGRQERLSRKGKVIKNSDGWYGRLEEFGTVKQSAHPFMRPAFDSKSNASIKAMADSFREGIKRGR